MDRPNWFICGNCLWWDRDDDSDDYRCCVHSENNNLEVKRESYCNRWTCFRCWGTWEEFFFPLKADTNDDIYEDYQLYMNHNNCKPIEFGNRE